MSGQAHADAGGANDERAELIGPVGLDVCTFPCQRWHEVRTTGASAIGSVGCVPRISCFHGIVITMFYKEHGRPHFHARYAEHNASIAIDNLDVLEGRLPVKSLALVRKWARLHRDELEVNWVRTRSGQPLLSIDPLP